MQDISGNAKVQIFGLGYIGLPTAVVMASAGHCVYGIDISKEIVEKLNKGSLHIYEPDLDALLQDALRRNRFSAYTEPKLAETHIVAVPTPVNHSDKSPDLSYVKSACVSIAKVLKKGDLVIIESTIPPRTCIDFVGPLIYELTGLRHEDDYHLCHCPERVIPGRILKELRENDRIVGGTTLASTDKAENLYRTFVSGTIIKTDSTTAEMCKLMENSFRDVNIALANEFADICRRNEVNAFEAIAFANRHPRVNIHTPSIGVGGHCIPVDPWFIIHSNQEEAQLLNMARKINDSRPEEVAKQILVYIAKNPQKRIVLMGVTYKPDVDDLRESPAIEVVRLLSANLQSDFLVIDPMIQETPKEIVGLPNVKWASISDVSTEDACVILVEHKAFLPLKKANRIILSVENNFSE